MAFHCACAHAARCTHVISDGEDVRQVFAHSGVIGGHEDRVEDDHEDCVEDDTERDEETGGHHEDCVEDDAERDEEVDERVHDEQLDDVSEALPASAALPVEQQLLRTHLEHLFDARLAPEPLTDNACSTRITVGSCFCHQRFLPKRIKGGSV